MSWKDEFSDDFEGTIEDYTYNKIKDFIYKQIKQAEDRGFFTKLRTSGCYSIEETQALLKEAREDEHKKTWDNVKDIYDTTDYKKHIEEAIKETEQRVAKEIMKTLNYKRLLEPNASKQAIQEFKEWIERDYKYKGVE